ncbi:hypothetical protein FRC01_004274, partial [Tulasnella sp. 417]
MALVSIAAPISERIDIAKRISNAEIKYRELSLTTLGSAGPSSGKKPDPTLENEQERVATILQECITPRLE